jgi:two-component system, cell cycle response regulator DivK
MTEFISFPFYAVFQKSGSRRYNGLMTPASGPLSDPNEKDKMTNILLVEDNELNRDMLMRRLQRKGYCVESAINGKEGLEKAETSLPDLILLDLSLPEMDGWEVLRHLKERAHLKSIPVIALTAHALVSDRDRAFAAGFDEYDIKPIELPRLLQKMETLLNGVKVS